MFWLHVSATSRHHLAVKRQSQFYNTVQFVLVGSHCVIKYTVIILYIYTCSKLYKIRNYISHNKMEVKNLKIKITILCG
jgi:hypothetical protein